MTAERVVRLEGEVDLSARTCVMQLLDEGVRALDAGDTLVVDLSAVTFLDSTGLHCIVNASRAAGETGARLVLRRASPQILRVLKITGLESYLEPPA